MQIVLVSKVLSLERKVGKNLTISKTVTSVDNV